jgi:hypothetical protein
MLEVEQAANDSEAVARLDKIKAQLGITAAPSAEAETAAAPEAAETPEA